MFKLRYSCNFFGQNGEFLVFHCRGRGVHSAKVYGSKRYTVRHVCGRAVFHSDVHGVHRAGPTPQEARPSQLGARSAEAGGHAGRVLPRLRTSKALPVGAQEHDRQQHRST